MRTAIVLVLVCCCLSAVSGQWLEKTVPLPDTFGGLKTPNCLVYDPADNTVFVAGESTRTVFVLDAKDGHRLARIPFEADIRDLCYDSASNRVYAAAMDRDLVAVIDAGTKQLVDTIPTGDSPIDLEYDPAFNRIYCANLHGNSVTVIDGAGDSVLATVPVEKQPNALCWNPNRNVVYCANKGSNTVSVIDAATNTVLDTVPTDSAPSGFVYNGDLNKLYTANAGAVTIVDGTGDSVLTTVGWGYGPFQLCYDPANSKVFVADANEYLTAIDCVSDTLLHRYRPCGARVVAYNPLNHRTYAVNNDQVYVINGATDTVIADPYFGHQPSAICVADSGRGVFIASGRAGLVALFDCAADSLSALTRTEVHVHPSAVSFNRTADKAYCAVEGANLVMVLDGANDSVRQLVPVGTGPRVLIHNPLGNKVYCANIGGDGTAASITVIDGEGDSVLRTIEIGLHGTYSPQGLCLNAAGSRLYQLSYDRELVVIDGVDDTVVGRVPLGDYPYGLCYGPAYDYVYVRAFFTLDVFDCEQNLLVAQVDVVPAPGMLIYNRVGSKVYTTGMSPGTVSVVAGERPELVADVRVGDDPSVLCWASVSNKVYCADPATGKLFVIDASVDTVVAQLLVGSNPCAMSYDSLNNYVYCACRGSDQVYVIDAHGDSVVTVITVGDEPFALAWNPFELRTYVANYASASISVLRDSLHPGITEGGIEALADRHATPTVVSGVLSLAPPSASNKPQAARLLDVSGRMVMELHAGTNDIHRLAPGVYFLREEVSGRRSGVCARKVVVTR